LDFQLPVFDASKKENRIQDSVARAGSKSRRQKPVVHFATLRQKARRQNRRVGRPMFLADQNFRHNFLALAKSAGFVGI
jgi:hypothetical protein